MKQFIPAAWKLQVKVAQRRLSDWSTGQLKQLVQPQFLSNSEKQLFQPRVEISQPIFANAYSENKKHNLKLAIAKVQDILILPNQIFSFWHLVGQPHQKQGYLEGRVIAGEKLRTEIGGGLCQLSGLIYFLILRAGITPLERHPHSKDIYTEENRFAPLGSDATVVYGYKDLRFQNSFNFPICFQFDLQSQAIHAAIYAPQILPDFQIKFDYNNLPDGVWVKTTRHQLDNPQFEILDLTFYPSL